MSRVCTICAHEQRIEIEKDHYKGVPNREIAKRYECSPSALWRHFTQGHALQEVAEETRCELARSGESYLDRLHVVEETAHKYLLKAEKSENVLEIRAWLKELRESLKVLAAVAYAAEKLKMEREAANKDEEQKNITQDPRFMACMTLIFKALDQYPEASAAVGRILKKAAEDGK